MGHSLVPTGNRDSRTLGIGPRGDARMGFGKRGDGLERRKTTSGIDAASIFAILILKQDLIVDLLLCVF